jgi:hypothetical protein
VVVQVYCGGDGGKHFQFTSKENELFCKACGKVGSKENLPYELIFFCLKKKKI